MVFTTHREMIHLRRGVERSAPWEFQKHPPKCEVFSEVSPDEECEKPTIARPPNEIKGDHRASRYRISDNSETWSIYLMKMGDTEIHLAFWWLLKEISKGRLNICGAFSGYKSVFAYSTSKDVDTNKKHRQITTTTISSRMYQDGWVFVGRRSKTSSCDW